jgi:hypothetical protein
MASRSPADRCPYARPFPPDFDACLVYERADYLPVDTRHDALQSVLTCANLAVKPGPQGGAFYGACRLGDEADRRRWAAKLGTDAVSMKAATG